MSFRSISLDQSALSPKEFESYKFFIDEFHSFTSSRAGRLRFAEAAQFLRIYFPFETEREDEIRSFFPQKVQLGEIDQGCVLAILRLLSHINNSKNTHPFQLYRDLIFLQTEPLPSLHKSQKPSSNPSTSSAHPDKNLTSSSNPFHSHKLRNPIINRPSNVAPLLPPKPSSCRAEVPQGPANTLQITLTRSQTFNHNRRVAPPLPPPRKRQESLHVHNPDSVPLDQIAQLTLDNSNESEASDMSTKLNPSSDTTSWITNNNKRSVSNSTSFTLPKSPLNYQKRGEKKIINHNEIKEEGKFTTTPRKFAPRRSVSLLVQNKPTPGTGNGNGTGTTTAESVIEQLKAIEVGLRHDGKELVKEVKEGWRLRHGKKEEKVPLVSRNTDLSNRITTPNTNNNHLHNNHLGNLVSSRSKASKYKNNDHDVHLQVDRSSDHHLDDVLADDLDDHHSLKSLNHDHHFHQLDSWHQLP